MLERIYKAQTTMDAAGKKLGRTINIMEVCGTHTVAIFRSGIRATLSDKIRLLSGPGCPVCVTSQGYIDTVIELAKRQDVIIATYGDMIRVPGRTNSLEKMQNQGNIKVVLSSEDALQLARENPNKTVVFIAVGFETTTPATAVAVQEAAAEGIENFCVLCGHKLVLPAMHALLSNTQNKIDAFLCPGHVSAIIGYGAYQEVVDKYKKPCVVAGFEPMQIIEGLAEICQELIDDKPQSTSIYHAVVTKNGNPQAQKIISECFEPADGFWRGVGKIEKSALKLKDKYKKYDALSRYNMLPEDGSEIGGCHCGQVLCGLMTPPQCELFGNTCTPENPVGPCMVSSEGTCAAWYKYGSRNRRK